MDVCTDRTFEFGADPATLWSALTSVERYRRWWPWLREFDGGSFVEGARWRCAVRSPLLYRVRFDVVLDEVAGRSASASVTGDIVGRARLDVTPVAGGGSRLRLVSTLSPESRFLRIFARIAPPLARFGHDRLLQVGVRQFRSRALEVGG